MKMKNSIISLGIVSSIIIPTYIAHGASVAGGELVFKGGQNDKVVYSDIRDAKSNSKYYKVWAAVKVGSSTYNSGWQNDIAYKDHARSFWSNETSHYDYYQR